MGEKEPVFTRRKTLEFLDRLDEGLVKDGHQRKFKLYCLGGTKMVLSGLRYMSKDVDFLLSRGDFTTLSSYVAEFNRRENMRFDVFPGAEFSGYSYPDFFRHSKKAPYKFRRLELYFIDDIDFVITKALAWRRKDVEDIKTILNKKKISRMEIMRRFEKVKFEPDREEEFRRKFDEFITEFYD